MVLLSKVARHAGVIKFDRIYPRVYNAFIMKKNNKPISIEDLAIMVKHGFDQMPTKGDFHKLDSRLDHVEEIQKDMLEELNATHTDVRYIRSTVDKLTQSDIMQDIAMKDLTSRVHRLEQKLERAR